MRSSGPGTARGGSGGPASAPLVWRGAPVPGPRRGLLARRPAQMTKARRDPRCVIAARGEKVRRKSNDGKQSVTQAEWLASHPSLVARAARGIVGYRCTFDLG